MTVLRLIGGLVASYALVVVAVAAMQDRLLFPRWAMGARPDALPAGAERVDVPLPGGGALVGVRIPATPPPPPDAPILIGFGGNAWDANVLGGYLHTLFPGRTILAFHYRGYGPSSGRPSAEALLADAIRIHDAVAGDEPAVAVGFSIGAGPAAHLARQRDLAGLILVTPFDSLVALARHHYPWLPVGLFLRHRMEVAADVAATTAPVAILTAERDTIVPARRSAGVRHAARHLVLDRTIAGAGHNDLYDRAAAAAAMRQALHKIEAHAARIGPGD